MEQTYEVSFQDGLKIYTENEEFRAVINKGGFIHCENRFVINHEKYVICTAGKMVLTEYAKTHEQECCLVFTLINSCERRF